MKQVIDNKKKKSLPKGIRHLASGKFIADVCINGKRKTKTVDTLEEAIIERQKMLQQYRDSTASDASASTAAGNDADLCTLDMLFKRTYNLYWKDTSWGKIAKNHYKQLSTFLGGGDHLSVTALNNINTLDSFVDYLIDQGNSNSTINRKLAILSKMLTTAVDRGIIEKVVKIPRRKEALHRKQDGADTFHARLQAPTRRVPRPPLHRIPQQRIVALAGARCRSQTRHHNSVEDQKRLPPYNPHREQDPSDY